jgi:hypothetical protein
MENTFSISTNYIYIANKYQNDDCLLESTELIGIIYEQEYQSQDKRKKNDKNWNILRTKRTIMVVILEHEVKRKDLKINLI